jgi:hypothetical protein
VNTVKVKVVLHRVVGQIKSTITINRQLPPEYWDTATMQFDREWFQGFANSLANEFLFANTTRVVANTTFSTTKGHLIDYEERSRESEKCDHLQAGSDGESQPQFTSRVRSLAAYLREQFLRVL